MRYVKVDWQHDHADEPVRLYSEYDDAGWEIRKVEVFRNGRLGCASAELGVGGARLGIEPLPGIDEIAAQPEFHPEPITGVEFERMWTAAQPVTAHAVRA